MKRMNSALDTCEAQALSKSYQQTADLLYLSLTFIMPQSG